MNTEKRDEGYNYIYSKLVEDPDDLLGIIAYSFYKQQKIEFIQAFKQENGRVPTTDELKTFFLTSNSPASIASYKAKAEALSREFIDTVLGEEIAEIQDRSDKELTARVRTLRPTFWSGVAQNIFASVLFVLLVGVILIFTWSWKYGATHVIEQVMDVEIKEHGAANPP
jgi:hypothetical protein